MQENLNKNEILTLDDIKLLVDSFYDKVRDNEMLAPIFNDVIKDHWPKHLEKMYRFWQTMLLDEQTYYGSPFLHHANLPVEKIHFDKWITLFYDTIDENFSGIKADEAKMRAIKMAEMFQYKIQNHRNNKDLKALL